MRLFYPWTDIITHLEVPNCLEWRCFSLCSPDNAAGETTGQIYPERFKKKKSRRKEKKLVLLSVNDQVDLFSFHWPAWPEAHGSRFSPAGHTDWRSRCSPPRRWCWPRHDPTPQPPGPSSPPACAWSAGTQTHQHPPNKTLISLA